MTAPRTLVAELADRQQVDQVFLIAEKQLRTNRTGGLYLLLRLADRSGTIAGLMWNVNERQAAAMQAGDFVQVRGATQIHNGALQMIVTHVEKVDGAQFDPAEFFPKGGADIEQLAVRLGELLRGVRNYPLRSLGEAFLADDDFLAKFTAAPAGVKNHHAYRGGLLEHVIELMELTQLVAPRYPQIDAELLLYGAFLHDLGKIDELSYDRQLGYTDAGQLIGHIVLGVGLLDAKIRDAERLSGEPFPAELALRLRHMVVSHHGQYEFGSPKLPMTLEAVVLHYLDDMDAKVHSFTQLMRDDPAPESNWTSFQPQLNRKIYKGASDQPAD